MRRVVQLSIPAAALLFASLAAAAPIMPFEEVRPGMLGIGRTVFRGTEIETFQVEILGKLPRVGPDQNLILARLSGGSLEQTGVLAGMSGSPVLIDGRLVGAVAYGWGFATEAIAGITPAEEMLQILDEAPVLATRAAAVAPGFLTLERLQSADRLRAFFDGHWERLAGRASTTPIPLSVSGIGTLGLARIAPRWADAGFLPVQAAAPAGDPGGEPREPLRPGSAMGVKLVSGDVEITATGTVTWVEGDRVLAFGHPLFGLGAIDLPLTAARVEATLPSLHQSMRLATPLGRVGALRQDRASGVAGKLGGEPRMIPVRLRLTTPSVGERSFRFEIADDPLLAPLLLYTTLDGILAGKERGFGSATVRLREGSVVKMLGADDVELDNLFAGPVALDLGSGLAAYVLYLMMNNPWSLPQVAGVNLLLDYESSPQTARIRRASVDRHRLAPGESAEVTVVLSPFRGPDQVLSRKIEIPAEAAEGKLTLHVGGALEVSRVDRQGEEQPPRDLEQLIRLINRLRRNDRVYILASQDETAVAVAGMRLPNLPPSAARIMAQPKGPDGFAEIAARALLEEALGTAYAVEGSARIELTVVRR